MVWLFLISWLYCTLLVPAVTRMRLTSTWKERPSCRLPSWSLFFFFFFGVVTHYVHTHKPRKARGLCGSLPLLPTNTTPALPSCRVEPVPSDRLHFTAARRRPIAPAIVRRGSSAKWEDRNASALPSDVRGRGMQALRPMWVGNFTSLSKVVTISDNNNNLIAKVTQLQNCI